MALFLAQLLALSALATDVTQSQHWISYTETNPYCVNVDLCAWESNPIVAGQPEAFKATRRFIEVGVRALPDMMSENEVLVATLIQGGVHMHSAISNNQKVEEFGFPRYWMLSYSWQF